MSKKKEIIEEDNETWWGFPLFFITIIIGWFGFAAYDSDDVIKYIIIIATIIFIVLEILFIKSGLTEKTFRGFLYDNCMLVFISFVASFTLKGYYNLITKSTLTEWKWIFNGIIEITTLIFTSSIFYKIIGILCIVVIIKYIIYNLLIKGK